MTLNRRFGLWGRSFSNGTQLPRYPSLYKSTFPLSPNTAFPPSEGTLSSRAVLAEYESVFPPRSSTSVKSSSGLISPSPTYPSLPPLPLMLPMSAFKTELLSPFAQLASNISKSAVSTPFESMMPGPTFLPRTLQTNSAELMSSPMSNKLNHHLDQNLGSQDRLFQHMDFPQLTVLFL